MCLLRDLHRKVWILSHRSVHVHSLGLAQSRVASDATSEFAWCDFRLERGALPQTCDILSESCACGIAQPPCAVLSPAQRNEQLDALSMNRTVVLRHSDEDRVTAIDQSPVQWSRRSALPRGTETLTYSTENPSCTCHPCDRQIDPAERSAAIGQMSICRPLMATAQLANRR